MPLERGGGGEVSWSKEGMSPKIDDGESTPFRCDPGLQGACLRSRFIHLFYLCIDRCVSVAEMKRQG